MTHMTLDEALSEVADAFFCAYGRVDFPAVSVLRAHLAKAAQPVEALDIGVGRDIVKRLRDTPNWLKEAWGDFKSAGANKYDRAPKEAADYIETLLSALAHPRPTGDVLIIPQDPLPSSIDALKQDDPNIARAAMLAFAEREMGETYGAGQFQFSTYATAPTGEQAGEVAWIDHTPSGVVLRTLGKCKRLEDLPHGTKLYAHPRPVGVPDGWEIEEDGKGFVRIASPECELHIGFMPPPSLEATTMLRDLACALLAAAPDGEVWL